MQSNALVVGADDRGASTAALNRQELLRVTRADPAAASALNPQPTRLQLKAPTTGQASTRAVAERNAATAPPSDAKPKAASECTAKPEKPKAEGFFARLRNGLRHMGFFGKAIFVLAVALIGGFLWRVRGGFLPTGSTILARIIGTLPLGLMAMFFLGPAGIFVNIALFFTLSWNGFGKAGAGVGSLGGILKMTGWGSFLTLVPGLISMAFGGGWQFAASGLLMGVIYGASRFFFPNAKFLYSPKLGGFIDGPGAISEVLMGMLIYGSFAVSMLNDDSDDEKSAKACKPDPAPRSARPVALSPNVLPQGPVLPPPRDAASALPQRA